MPYLLFALVAKGTVYAAPTVEAEPPWSDLQISNIPEELVIDILNVTPEDFMKGLSKRNINRSSFLYKIDDHGQIQSAIWLTFGDQRLYIMPQARNVKVKVTDFKLTSEIEIRYDIGGTTYQQVFDEDRYSCFSQMFWSRVFRPRPYLEEPQPSQADAQPSTSKMSSAINWTPPVIKLEEQDRYDVPEDDVELTDHIHLSKEAESYDHRRINDTTAFCVNFQNKNMRWNGIFLHGVKVPVSRFCDKFTICYVDISQNTCNVIVAAHVESVWMETYYVINGLNTHHAKLIPLRDPGFFNDFNELPSRVRPKGSNFVGKVVTLDTENFNENTAQVEVFERQGQKVYRCKDGELNSIEAQVRHLKFGGVDYSLPRGHKFFLLAFSRPYLSTYFATLITKQGFLYSVRKWHGSSEENMNTFPLDNPESVITALSNVKAFLEYGDESETLSRIYSHGDQDGDIICLSSVNSGSSVSSGGTQLCKPLDKLKYTEVITKLPNLTALRCKPNTPRSYVVLGGAVIELNQEERKSETMIYFHHSPKNPRNIIITNKETGVRAAKETGVGTLIFEAVEDAVVDPPESAKVVDVDVNRFAVSGETGITWYKRWLDNLWVIVPSKHPEYIIGSVSFNGCKIIPTHRGYSFIVTPNQEPKSIVIFYATGEFTRLAVKLTHASVASNPTCYLEVLDYEPTTMGIDNVRKLDFDSIFNTRRD